MSMKIDYLPIAGSNLFNNGVLFSRVSVAGKKKSFDLLTKAENK
jgi:hypothetical protein